MDPSLLAQLLKGERLIALVADAEEIYGSGRDDIAPAVADVVPRTMKDALLVFLEGR